MGSGHGKAAPGVAVSASSGRGAGEGGAHAAPPGGPFTQHATPRGHAHAPYSLLGGCCSQCWAGRHAHALSSICVGCHAHAPYSMLGGKVAVAASRGRLCHGGWARTILLHGACLPCGDARLCLPCHRRLQEHTHSGWRHVWAPHTQFGPPPSAHRAAFSEGTRDCIGRNLAYMDMRTILLVSGGLGAVRGVTKHVRG